MSSAPSLRQRAYEHIQRKILCGDLASGNVVSELSLAREIGISRTPVREAIQHLEHDGVLEQVPRYGTVVRRLERRDLVELFELRQALEPFAVARAAGHIDPEGVERLTRLCNEIRTIAADLRAEGLALADADRMRRLLSADMAFHLLLIRASGNGRMVKIIADSRLLTRIFATRRQAHDLKVLDDTYRDHMQILKAVKNGDGGTAQRKMQQHIADSFEQALAHFDRTQQLGSDTQSLNLPSDLLDELNEMEREASAPAKRKAARTTIRKSKR
jgi:DNA-binding GntR family transcriptional regulator